MSELYKAMLSIFPAIPLPLNGQKVLAENHDPHIIDILAASGTTHLDIVDKMVGDGDPFEHCPRYAYARTRNVTALTDAFKAHLDSESEHERDGRSYHNFTKYAATNVNTPQQLLSEAINDRELLVAFGALCNPATPQEAKRNISPGQMTDIIKDGHSRENRLLRAKEIITTNPWICEDNDRWEPLIRVAIGETPRLNELAKIEQRLSPTATTWQHQFDVWPNMRPQKYDMYSTKKLLTLDDDARICAYNRNDFTINHAYSIVKQQIRGTLSTQLAGRFINRYGVLVLCDNNPQAEQRGVSWYLQHAADARLIAPVLELVDWRFLGSHQDITKTVTILGKNRHNWENFVALLPEWHGDTCEEAARTAIKL